MQDLTKAEEQVMQYLWMLEKAFVKDIVECFSEPRPAYNTVSTIVRILETKGFIGHEELGRSHQYYPLITKEEYTRYSVGNLLENYFSGSPKAMLSFFVKEKKLSASELDSILKTIEKGKK